MSCIVEVAARRTDLAASLATMRVWLDHRLCDPARFETTTGPPGVVVMRVEFEHEQSAKAFARAFGGQVMWPAQAAAA